MLNQPALVQEVDFMPGERLDLVFDFSLVGEGSRVIVENILGEESNNSTILKNLDPNRRTNRIIAFDITSTNAGRLKAHTPSVPTTAVRTRKLGLYEGKDHYGRLMPMLGTVEPVTDVNGNVVNGSLSWNVAITENPNTGDIEIWEIYNNTVDAHPIHVHLVYFEIMSRSKFSATSIV